MTDIAVRALLVRWWWRRLLTERAPMWLAWALPRRAVYWAAIRVIAHATQGKWGSTEVPTLTAMDALRRWEIPPR
jgi:hypothetical protein